MKMNQLFTGYYSDRRTAYEKPLEWIYAHQGESSVEIRPTLWIWKAERAQVYFVDYVGDGIGCTLATFDRLADAQEYREKLGEMTEEEFESWLIDTRWAKRA